MKSNKSVFFIVFILILAFAASTVFGVKNQYGDLTTVYIKGLKEIRLGIDIQGGVDVTFGPEDGTDATTEQLEAVEEVMKSRLISLGINDYEVYVDDNNDKVIVRFPWKSGEENFDPKKAVEELGETAKLQFRKGYTYTSIPDENGNVTVIPGGEVIIEGSDVEEAFVRNSYDNNGNITHYCDAQGNVVRQQACGVSRFQRLRFPLCHLDLDGYQLHFLSGRQRSHYGRRRNDHRRF